MNQWSNGPPDEKEQVIGPGCLHWTQAGSGMMHEEVPTVSGKSCHGLQMFVKLPASQEVSAPACFHVNDPPEYISNNGNVRVRVLVGSFQVKKAAFVTGNGDGLTYLDVHLKRGGSKVDIPAPQRTTAFILSIKGNLSSTDSNGTTTVIEEGAGVFFDATNGGDMVSIMSATDNDDDDDVCEFLFCGGIPNKEPLVSRGSFMMSTAERIAEAERNYKNGSMGHIEPLNIEAMWKDGEL
jgi:redox-sensitive bicupin YhaK (pirin superfamily)